MNPESAGRNYELLIEENGVKKTHLCDLAFGDVFLFGGQSNMEYPLKDEANYDDSFSLKNIRIYTVPRVEYIQVNQKFPAFENSGWKLASSSALSDFSAIAAYTGQILNHLSEFNGSNEEEIPIGLVSCNKGGTSVSCWMDENSLKKDPDLYSHFYKRYWDDIQDQSDQTEDLKREEFAKISRRYLEACNQFKIHHPKASRAEMKRELGHTPWPGPKGKKDFGRPCGLFETMFSNISGLPFKAVIWYQGEEDTKDGEFYESLLLQLIECWRASIINRPDFYIVQLPGYNDDPAKKWPLVREAQRKVCSKLSYCHLITAIDAGSSDNIHPADKLKLGKRIGQFIYRHEYCKESVSHPEIIEVIQSDQKTLVRFDQPLFVKNPDAGQDSNPALIPIDLQDTIVFNKGQTSSAYENDPTPVYFYQDGSPLSPFTL
ncbi:sialate O-acetylesterase [Ileibacterium valens]|uniref:sialate O-acetylesterase n=1 Tax=Ileibacterium valens TaxID=1862668 RepID=UPI0025B76060|nr:sialate O-acetylesterase [Ileibacterium valens]